MRIDIKDYVQREKRILTTARENLSRNTEKLPSLLIVQWGDDDASNSYIKGKIKDCAEIGISTTLFKTTSVEHLKEFINKVGSSYTGIIFQEPMDIGALAKQSLIDRIFDSQDVDGFKANSCYKPCTPQGIINFLKYYLKWQHPMDKNADMKFFRSPLSGKVITVVGQGKLVGEPLVPMLMAEGATVLSCNSKTMNLKEMTKAADIVISAVGKSDLITREMLKDGAIVIDAGISVVNGKLFGDCDKNLYEEEDVWVSTVPGGVGLLTRLELVRNVIKGAEGEK